MAISLKNRKKIIAILSVFVLIMTFFPAYSSIKAAGYNITLNKTQTFAGYTSPVEIIATSDNAFLTTDGSTIVSLLNGNTPIVDKIANINVSQDKKSVSFSLKTGVTEGNYIIQVSTPTDNATTNFKVVTPSVTLSKTQIAQGYISNINVTATGTNTAFESGKTSVTLLKDGVTDASDKITGLTVVNATTVNFQIKTGLTQGTYTVNFNTNGEKVSKDFVVTQSGTITLGTTSVKQGYTSNVNVDVTGTNTNFETGKTIVNLVDSSGNATGKTANVVVANPTVLRFAVKEGLTEGNYTVKITTNNEAVETPFMVTPPASVSISPNVKEVGYNELFTVTATGANINFNQNATNVVLVDNQGVDQNGIINIKANGSQTMTFQIRKGIGAGAYIVRITTINNGNSETVTANFSISDPNDITPPAMPTGFTAAAGDSKVTLNWNKNTEVDLAGYNIYRDGTKIETVSSDKTSYTDSNLTNGTTYSYQLTAIDASGNESSKTDAKTATPKVDSKQPTPPSNNEGNNAGSPTPPNQSTNNGKGEVLISNDAVKIEKTSNADGKVSVIVTLSKEKVAEELKNITEINTFKIQVAKASDKEEIAVLISEDILEVLRGKNNNAVIEIATKDGAYKLPISEINKEVLSKQLGVSNNAVTISVKVNEVADEKNVINKNNLKPSTRVIDYTIEAEANGKTVVISTFRVYVEREIVSTKSFNANISTAVRLNDDGTFTPVPTRFSGNVASFMSKSNSKYTVVENQKTFADVQNHWSKNEVELLASKYIVSGKTETSFDPNNSITRAEFTALVVRALGLEPSTTGNANFKDVKASDWYTGYVNTAVEAGIVSGYTDQTFRANNKITRQELSVLISNAMKAAGKDTKVAGTDSKLAKFIDQAEIGVWAKADVALMIEKGITIGKTANTFAPLQNATRAESTVMLKRFMQNVGFID